MSKQMLERLSDALERFGAFEEPRPRGLAGEQGRRQNGFYLGLMAASWRYAHEVTAHEITAHEIVAHEIKSLRRLTSCLILIILFSCRPFKKGGVAHGRPCARVRGRVNLKWEKLEISDASAQRESQRDPGPQQRPRASKRFSSQPSASEEDAQSPRCLSSRARRLSSSQGTYGASLRTQQGRYLGC